MTRAALLLPSLLLAACTVGEIPSGGGGGGGGMPDGGGGMANGCMPALTADRLQDAHIHTAGGTDNHDMDCTMSGCHVAGNPGGAPIFLYGGTIYAKGGTTPAMGAPVIFTPTGGQPIAAAYTDKGGNFYVMDDGTLTLPFSGNVAASACPDIRKMSGLVMTQSCAVAGTGCHAKGTGAGGVMTVGI